MKLFLDKIFPLSHIRNVAVFYILSSVYNMWFVAGVWVFIWGRFMTGTQIGISDAITFAIGFLFELPSGVLADVIGRKKAIVFGNLMLVVGNLFVALSSSFAGITTWYLVWTIGYAFQSGATEALAYDSVKQAGNEEDWQKVIATSTVVSKTTTLICTALGGIFYATWFRLPYLAFAITGLIGLIAALLLQEIQVQKIENWSVKLYVNQIKDGVMTLLRKAIFPFSLLSLSVAGITYMYNWGLLRPLTGERFGFTPVTYPFLLSVISFGTIVANLFIVKLRKKIGLERFLLTVGTVFAGIFFIMSWNHSLIIGGGIMVLISILSNYTDQLFSQFINLHTRAEHRATTLSAVALFTKAPYVMLSILIGRLSENNLLPEFTFIVGIVAFGISLLAWQLRNKSLKIQTI